MFFIYLSAPQSALGPYRGNSHTHPIWITALFNFGLKGLREPRNEVESLSPAEFQVGFEQLTFRFYFNVLTHRSLSPNICRDCTVYCCNIGLGGTWFFWHLWFEKMEKYCGNENWCCPGQWSKFMYEKIQESDSREATLKKKIVENSKNIIFATAHMKPIN